MSEPNINENVEAAMKVIMKEVNTLGKNTVAETIAEVLMRDHRTLQQNFMREFVKALCIYSDSYTDLRNEASVDFAMKVKQMEHYFPMV